MEAGGCQGHPGCHAGLLSPALGVRVKAQEGPASMWGGGGAGAVTPAAAGRPEAAPARPGPGGWAAPEEAQRGSGAGAEARRPPRGASPVPRTWWPGDSQETPGLGGRRRPHGPGTPMDPREPGAVVGAPARW